MTHPIASPDALCAHLIPRLLTSGKQEAEETIRALREAPDAARAITPSQGASLWALAARQGALKTIEAMIRAEIPGIEEARANTLPGDQTPAFACAWQLLIEEKLPAIPEGEPLDSHLNQAVWARAWPFCSELLSLGANPDEEETRIILAAALLELQDIEFAAHLGHCLGKRRDLSFLEPLIEEVAQPENVGLEHAWRDEERPAKEETMRALKAKIIEEVIRANLAPASSLNPERLRV